MNERVVLFAQMIGHRAEGFDDISYNQSYFFMECRFSRIYLIHIIYFKAFIKIEALVFEDSCINKVYCLLFFTFKS